MQTVLVIDDDAALRDTIGLMLEREGFRPALAGDGKTGLKQALTLKPDLLLVDLRMPGLNGIEVCCVAIMGGAYGASGGAPEVMRSWRWVLQPSLLPCRPH